MGCDGWREGQHLSSKTGRSANYQNSSLNSHIALDTAALEIVVVRPERNFEVRGERETISGIALRSSRATCSQLRNPNANKDDSFRV